MNGARKSENEGRDAIASMDAGNDELLPLAMVETRK
jgi:hypothetical protein